MFNRYLIITTIAVTIFVGVILLTFAISVHTSASYNPIDIESREEVSVRLITSIINKYNPDLPVNQKNLICQTIMRESNANQFDPFFIVAVIAAESSFVPQAVSPCAAQGLMQLTDGVVEMMRITDPFDIQENIFAGTKYLYRLRQMFKNAELTLAAYNAGPTRVARLGTVPQISETINYISKVQRFYLDMQAKFHVAMISFTVYPIYFQLESSPARHLPQPNIKNNQPRNGHYNPETVTAFLEIKRSFRYQENKTESKVTV